MKDWLCTKANSYKFYTAWVKKGILLLSPIQIWCTYAPPLSAVPSVMGLGSAVTEGTANTNDHTIAQIQADTKLSDKLVLLCAFAEMHTPSTGGKVTNFKETLTPAATFYSLLPSLLPHISITYSVLLPNLSNRERFIHSEERNNLQV